MSFSKPFRDGFSNWCCCVLGLKIAQTVLQEYSKIKSAELQSMLKEKCGDRICAGIHEVQVKEGTVTVLNKCPDKECDGEKWANMLLKLNRDGHMNNVKLNIDRWITDSTSLQALFMGHRFERRNHGVTSEYIDVAGLLQFLTNCKAFHADDTECEISVGDITKEELAKMKKIQEIRNKLMHSASLELSLDDKNDNYASLVSFIQIRHFKGMKNTCETAKSEMIMLRDGSGETKTKLQVEKLRIIFRTVREFKDKMQYGCVNFDPNQMAIMINKAKNDKDDGWNMMKYDTPIDVTDRIALADILEKITSCIATVEEATTTELRRQAGRVTAESNTN